MEKMTNSKNNQETYKMLREKMNSIGVKISSKEEFQEKFDYYKKNWKKLTKE
jgi:hypothetical protein